MRSTIVVLLFCAASAAAEPPVDELRAFYEAGRAHFNRGNYTEAAREFERGYELSHRPTFLLDAGYAHHRLGNDTRAAELLRKYLDEADPRDPGRPEAQRLLSTLPVPVRRPATTTPPVTATPPVTPPPPAEVAVTPSVQITTTPARITVTPPHRSKWRRYGWLLPVGAAVIVGVTLGVYFGVTGDPCRGASACISEHSAGLRIVLP